MRRILVAGLLVALCMVVAPAMAGGGFDRFGYNYQARVFIGAADGVDRMLDGAVWGDPTCAKDHLVMKWSKAWDDARFHGAPWSPEAWVNNEWNGKVPGGSGVTEIVKIQWIGDCGADQTPLPDGGYCIWGQFEAIMDHYTGKGGVWLAHATPTGYGA